MAAPVTGEASLAEERFDAQFAINKLKTPNSDNLIIAQLSKTPLNQPHVPCAPSLSKRRKSKPMRFEVSRNDVQKERTCPKIKMVLNDPSLPCLSLTKEKSPSKSFKTPVPSSPAMIRDLEQWRFSQVLGSSFLAVLRWGLDHKSVVVFGWSFLPEEDAAFLLEDEKGEQCEVKYIAYKIVTGPKGAFGTLDG